MNGMNSQACAFVDCTMDIDEALTLLVILVLATKRKIDSDWKIDSL